MSVRRSSLLSLTCVFLPAVGFALTCIGAYLVSLQPDTRLKSVPVYALIVFGFLAMLIGVFYVLCKSMTSKLYQRRPSERHIQIFAIERPRSSPPSYDESQTNQIRPGRLPEVAVPVDGVDVTLGLAPPLYSQDCSEAPNCTWSWEPPPQYSQVAHIQHGQIDQGRLFP
ncbi:uncharacterized protein ACNS7B_011701 [Menidia menidia]